MDQADPQTAAPAGWRKARLRAEFAAFFVAVPVLGAILLPPDAMFTLLFALTGLGLWLLHRTPGFRWRELIEGWRDIDWRFVAALACVTAFAGYGIVRTAAPEAVFFPARAMPGLMAMIVVLYPFLSALPQEVLFRPLFFRRYAPILPGGRGALVLNAAIFSLAHLMYWSWIVAALTFAGGLAFAHAYRRHGFPTAVAAHAAAGIVVFGVGLGVFFYSGNVTRPF
jgi:hypothetical protein